MYVKIFNSILDSSLAEDRRLRHFFIDLLLCSDGDGNVLMTNAAISRRTGADLEEVEWGLAELQKPDVTSLSREYDGRRILPLEGHGYGWKIVNYAHYRDIKSDEQRRRDTAERVRRWRAKKAGIVHLEPEAKHEKDDGNDPDFDAFWKAYPRKVGKGQAERAWRKNGRPELAVILEAVRRQAATEQWQKEDGKYIPHPATWLNGKRWLDQGVVAEQPVVERSLREMTDEEILREVIQ